MSARLPIRDVITLKELTLALLRHSKDCWNARLPHTLEHRRLSAKTLRTREWLLKQTHAIEEGEVEGLTRQPKSQIRLGSFTDGSLLFLPPLDDDEMFVPVMSMEIDSEKRKTSFRISLYRNDNDNRPIFVGFRFETPSEGSEKHRYFHAQPIESDLYGIVKWREESPGTVPCIPVSAKNPVTLFLCLVLSLYGRNGTRVIMTDLELAKEHKDFLRRLDSGAL